MKTTPLLLCVVLASGLTSCVIDATGSAAASSETASAASGEVSQRIINDCRAALRRTFPTQQMSVVDARMGETSYIVDFEVEGAEAPWRCYHDGSKVTGTEYQGEG